MEEEPLTPSKVLFNVLDKLEAEAEAENILIIWTAEDGNINWESNSLDTSLKLGMMEFVKYAILNQKGIFTKVPGE